MYGQTRYRFDRGTVTITKLDPDDFAPNDSDLEVVKEEMRRMLAAGATHLTFTISGMRVEISPDIESIMREAIKPLERNQRIHP